MNRSEGGTDPYIVVIGDSIMDIMASATSTIHPSAIQPCRGIYHKCGGCARNTAENLVRLGCDTRLISAFGDDIPGRDLMDHTGQAHVDLTASRVMPDTASAICLIVNDPKGEHFCMVSDYSITDAITPAWLAEQAPLLDNAALIVANTVLSEEALAWMFTRLAHKTIMIDTVAKHLTERIRPWLSGIHTLKCNRTEAQLLTGKDFISSNQAPDIAGWFHRCGVSQVILSLGEYGVYYSNGTHAGWIAPLPVQVVDVTGAGDALMAGLACGWINDWPFTDTVRFACGCAALTITTKENNHPQLSQATVRALC